MTATFDPTTLTPFDKEQWDEVQRWRGNQMREKKSRSLPAPVQTLAQRSKDRAQQVGDRIQDLPGVDQLGDTLTKSLNALAETVGKMSEASLQRDAVLKAYAKRGHDLAEVEDIRSLPLREVLKVKPALDLRYVAAMAASGAAAGAVSTGGVGVATGTAGVGLLPGVATTLGALAADTTAVMTAANRVISETAAYYGYDTSIPSEQVFASSLLGLGLMGDGAQKQAAFLALNRVMQDIAHRAAWKALDQHAATMILKMVYRALGHRLTRQKLTQAIPAAGIVVGAGMNARMMSGVAAVADHMYRERFLREKYGIPFPGAEVAGGERVEVVAEEIIATIVDEPTPAANG